jgi:cytidylate kinase
MALFDEHAMVFVTGISAAGKSTVGELLAQRFARGVHVRGDVFRRMVLSGREEMTSEPSDEALRQLRLRYRLGAMVADEYFDAAFSVVVQDIVLGADLAAYVGSIRSRPLYVVVLLPESRTVEARDAGRQKTAYGPGRPPVAELDRALRDATPRIGLWLDTSRMSPEESVDEIARRADEARV